MKVPTSSCRGRLALFGLLIAGLAAIISPAECRAQSDTFDLGGLTGNKAGKGQIQLTTMLIAKARAPGAIAVLSVTASLPPDYYIYSTKPGWSGATRIRVIGVDGLEPIGPAEFTADHEPKVVFEKNLGTDGLEVEKFFDQVTWQRRYRIVKPELAVAAVELRGQYCTAVAGGNCIPIIPAYQAFVGLTEGDPGPFAADVPRPPEESAAAPALHPFTQDLTPGRKPGDPQPVSFTVRLSPENAKPGERVTLAITAQVDAPYHTFALDNENTGLPTQLSDINLQGLKPESAGFEPSQPPTIDRDLRGLPQRTHYGEITWTRQYVVLPETEPGRYGVAGSVRFMACREGHCNLPKTLAFAVGYVAEAPSRAARPVARVPGAPGSRVWDLNLQPQDDVVGGSLPLFLLYAFIGGMILNVMPCVLPVIAIKVLSFVQQAGESRGRILALNLTYSLGVLAVFLTLAALAVLPKEALGWGELFQKPEFNLVMACLVFALGLSLLGVFEIPVPGMIGSAAGHQQEGLLGAFLTGIFATLLATPCSGPFLGATLAWSVNQSVPVAFLVWGVMGLGMAFPYIVFGLFPGAIKWLPKPGNWMVRFKEFSGFVLLGSVVFIISFTGERYTIPTLVMLIGVSLGLWMIGSLYDHRSPVSHKNAVRVAALALSGAICFVGFRMTSQSADTHRLDWVEFSESKLDELIAGRKTVLIDFTADWCLTCKTVEKLSLNRAGTHEMVAKHGIVPLVADYTDTSPDLKRWLDRFQSKSIPLTVIFPANDPTRPILLRDFYTQSALLKKLEQAVATPDVKATQAARTSDGRR